MQRPLPCHGLAGVASGSSPKALPSLSSSSLRNDGIKACDVLTVLREKVAFVSGGRDKRGGPILTFPARSNHDRIKQEDLRKLVTYLSTVPSEDVSKRGFTVIIDMRGSKWDLIKPLLKTLQEAFPAEICVALIIKPDNFWQKQKTNFGSAKFTFETSMVSVEGLTKLVDPSQLTADLEGTLEYDHVEWTELRVSLEEFTGGALHLLSRLEELQEVLSRQDLPLDAEESRRLLEEHARLRKTITKAPVDGLDQEGQRLLQRIRDGGDGRLSGGPDFQSLVPKVAALLDKLQATRQHLLQAWHARKQQLDQCFQLRLYEQDAEKRDSREMADGSRRRGLAQEQAGRPVGRSGPAMGPVGPGPSPASAVSSVGCLRGDDERRRTVKVSVEERPTGLEVLRASVCGVEVVPFTRGSLSAAGLRSRSHKYPPQLLGAY
ncbi:hypothetical protein ACEWY4_017016 [Coilia grayii]|uniref:CRAL-TRIO domain-containing protein n=1 Tax=Coilia grayii TaxID=363190 RepID=A0ABD1JPR1_9TELE